MLIYLSKLNWKKFQEGNFLHIRMSKQFSNLYFAVLLFILNLTNFVFTVKHHMNIFITPEKGCYSFLSLHLQLESLCYPGLLTKKQPVDRNLVLLHTNEKTLVWIFKLRVNSLFYMLFWTINHHLNVFKKRITL